MVAGGRLVVSTASHGVRNCTAVTPICSELHKANVDGEAAFAMGHINHGEKQGEASLIGGNNLGWRAKNAHCAACDRDFANCCICV